MTHFSGYALVQVRIVAKVTFGSGNFIHKALRYWITGLFQIPGERFLDLVRSQHCVADLIAYQLKPSAARIWVKVMVGSSGCAKW